MRLKAMQTACMTRNRMTMFVTGSRRSRRQLQAEMGADAGRAACSEAICVMRGGGRREGRPRRRPPCSRRRGSKPLSAVGAGPLLHQVGIPLVDEGAADWHADRRDAVL